MRWCSYCSLPLRVEPLRVASEEKGAVAGITRENLRERTLLVLKRGGWSDPDVLLVRVEGESH